MNNSLTKDELQALIKIVNATQTTVGSADSWVALRTKLHNALSEMELREKKEAENQSNVDNR